jgi:hypothetical protein
MHAECGSSVGYGLLLVSIVNSRAARFTIERTEYFRHFLFGIVVMN